MYYLSEQFHSYPANIKLTIPDDLLYPSEKYRGKKSKEVRTDSTMRTLFDMARKGANFVKNSIASSFSSNEPQLVSKKKLVLKKESELSTSTLSTPATFVTNEIDDSQYIEELDFGDDLINIESFDIELQERLMAQYEQKDNKTTDVIIVDNDDSQVSAITKVKDEPKKLNLKRKVPQITSKQPAKKKTKFEPPAQKSTLLSFWSKKL